MPMMSTTPSMPPSACAGVVEHALHVGAVERIAAQRSAADLRGDVGGEVGILVDAHQARAHRRERVRRLAADALTRAEHDEPAAVEPEQAGIVGDGRVVGAGHDADTCRVHRRRPDRSSWGISSVPSSSMVRRIDSCSRWPNCT